MNDLEKYFYNNKKKSIHKWIHYFEIYDHYLNCFRDKEIKFLEIGISEGGSLQMWKEYFGEKCLIYGIDSDPKRFYKEDRITIEIGSQEDREFLKKIACKHGPFDIIIDDGGHKMNQQITSIEELYPSLKLGGIYLVEDIHTSYYRHFDGGLKNSNSFIEYSKNMIDVVNNRANNIKNNIFGENLISIAFHEDIVVFNKNKKPKRKAIRLPFK